MLYDRNVSSRRRAGRNTGIGNVKKDEDDKLYLMLVSVHGLIRGENMELGRDADTGGQTKYVVELARALGERPEVGRVDLLTRHIDDPRVDRDYAEPVEILSDKARIVRLKCCGTEYVPKEELWDGLDDFVDNTLEYLRAQPRLPDVIHSHYADAGHVGARLSMQMGIPLVHTGHSLGRVKRRRLLAGGLSREQIESRYRIKRRIEAEEETLSAAGLVITSTAQEIESQYGMYNYYRPGQMRVISPGTDLSRFYPPRRDEWASDAARAIGPFLSAPAQPIIMALSRPDRRKNIVSLIDAYGQSPELQRRANLVLVAGNRDDIRDLDVGTREVMTDILLAIDRHNLYGKVAYPKQHSPDDVPVFYRLAALSGGVFINPALTEPFGLTLIEAAASGLPIVATEDGGPVDIIDNCRNGVLISPLDLEGIAKAVIAILDDRAAWERYAANGLDGVSRHYSWQAHVGKYLDELKPLISKAEPLPRHTTPVVGRAYRDRAIFTDLDHSLIGDPESLGAFVDLIRTRKREATFGIATRRRLKSALRMMWENNIPMPDVLITGLGTAIHYAPDLVEDRVWSHHVDHLWHRDEVRRLLEDVPGLTRLPGAEQDKFRLSFAIDHETAPDIGEIRSLLHQNEQTVNVFPSYGKYLDVVPARASKGFALRWFADQREVPLEQILAVGGAGADEDIMRGNTLAVVAAHRHHEELSELKNTKRIYFARKPYAAGILEAIDYYDFFGACRDPES